MFPIHVFIRIAVSFLIILLPLPNMDEWFYDRLMSLHKHKNRPTDIVLVRINNPSLSQSFLREAFHYPKDDLEPGSHARTTWHNAFYTSLLTKLNQYKPQAIIFTSYFDSVDQPQLTEPLPPNVILSAYLNEESKLIPPPMALTSGTPYGFSNVFPDSDNVVRRAQLVYSSSSSLAIRTHHLINPKPISRSLIEPLLIDYRGPAGSYLTIDSKDILEDEISARNLQGKVILIGREGSRYSEYETPMGKMTKLEIQANIIDNFLTQEEIRLLPRWVNYLISTIAVGTSVALILYLSLTVAWISLLVMCGLFLAISYAFMAWGGYWAGVANPVVCIFCTHLLMLGYKLGKQEEQQWKLQQESAYLKEMDQFKNNFISLFSHDLKTPIAKIKAITDRLLNENPSFPPTIKEALGNIDRTSTELARFISDILKVTKMESMPLEPTKDVIDLNRLAEEAVQRLKFLAEEKQIQIILDLEPLFSMEGDPQLILEVITNLIENAIKYSPSHKKVIVRTLEEHGKVKLEVIDEGNGISQEELPRVTGKFYRGKSASQTTKGSGLGLYLSKYFLELHEGQLDIKSEMGKGTRVSFTLPLPA